MSLALILVLALPPAQPLPCEVPGPGHHVPRLEINQPETDRLTHRRRRGRSFLMFAALLASLP